MRIFNLVPKGIKGITASASTEYPNGIGLRAVGAGTITVVDAKGQTTVLTVADTEDIALAVRKVTAFTTTAVQLYESD